MATYAGVDDVLNALDSPMPAETRPWIQNRLDYAEALVTAAAGDLAERITAGTTTAEAIRLVLVEMTLRVVRNPGGYRQETAGPFAYTLDPAVSSGRLHLSRDDRRLLGLGAGAATIPLEDPALEYVHRAPYGWWPDSELPTP